MIENTPNNQELPFLAALFTSLLCIVFGANTVAIKISLSGLGAFTTAGLRFGMATCIIFLWAKITRRTFGIKKGQAHQLLIISLLFTVQLGLLYFGLSKTNASRGTLLINLQPFFVLFLAHYFIPGDRITKKKILGDSLGGTKPAAKSVAPTIDSKGEKAAAAVQSEEKKRGKYDLNIGVQVQELDGKPQVRFMLHRFNWDHKTQEEKVLDKAYSSQENLMKDVHPLLANAASVLMKSINA